MEPITAVAIVGVSLVAKGALESAGQEAGRSGWAGGARLLERLQARFRGDGDAEGALDRVQRSPDDDDAQEQLMRILLTYMLRDPSFEADVRRLVKKAEAGQGGAQVRAAYIKNAQVFNEKVEIKGDWNNS